MSQAADPGGEARAGTASTRPTHSAEAARLMRLATYASVATATVLIAVKLVAWLYTDSVSLLSTLIDSVLDALASIINLVAVRHALMPADREHRFGHGKAEPLAALGQATFISGSALFLVFEASHRLFNPAPIAHTGSPTDASVPLPNGAPIVSPAFTSRSARSLDRDLSTTLPPSFRPSCSSTTIESASPTTW